MCFLGLFLFFIVIGVSVLFTIVMGSKFGEGSFYSLKGFNSSFNGNANTNKAVKTHPTIGYYFDGSTYIESSAVMDYYSQTVVCFSFLPHRSPSGSTSAIQASVASGLFCPIVIQSVASPTANQTRTAMESMLTSSAPRSSTSSSSTPTAKMPAKSFLSLWTSTSRAGLTWQSCSSEPTRRRVAFGIQ